MDTVQLSPRLHVLRWIGRHDGDGALAEVRDAASGATSWALWFARRRDVGLVVALHHRALLFSGLDLFAPLVDCEIVDTEDGTAVLFAPLDGAPAHRPLASSGSGLVDALHAWRAGGVRAGRLDDDAWWSTQSGPRLLPHTWLAPLVPDALSTHAATFDFARTDGEVRSAARALGVLGAFEADDRADLPRSFESDAGGELLDALTELRERGGWLSVVDADARGVADVVERWCRGQGRPCVRLTAYAHLAPPRRVGESTSVVVLEGVESFASVADALAELQRAGWIDGHETYVLVNDGRSTDEALRLYAGARFGRGAPSPVHRTTVASSVPPAALDVGEERLLELLVAAGRAVTGHVLARCTGQEPLAIARSIQRLEALGRVRTAYATHAEAPGVQLLVESVGATDRTREDLDPSRDLELRALLAASIETRPKPSFALQWLRADAPARRSAAEAARRWRELAQRAHARGRDLLAFAAYERLLASAPSEVITLEDRVKAAIGRSGQYQRGGDVERATAVLTHALDETRGHEQEVEADLEAELVLTLAALEIHRSDYAAAEQRLSALLARSKERLGVESRARAYVDLGWALLFLGRSRESVRTSELALRILDPLRHPALVARTHNQIGFALYKESDYAGSIVHYERALRLREQLGDELGVARTYNNLALTQRALGRPEEAAESLRESLRRKRAAGDELSYAASLINLGLVQLDLGQPDAAERSAVQCLEIARAHGHPDTEAEAWGLRGEAALAKGDSERALEYLERDLAICDATEHQSERLATLRRIAEALLVLDRASEASERLALARELLVAQPSRYETAMIDRLDAEIRLRAGEAESAVELFAAAARGLGALGLRGPQVDAIARRGLAELELGHGARARALLGEVRELVGRHELHAVPSTVDDLERALARAPVSSGPLTADDCLDVLVQALVHPTRGIEDASRVASSLATALAARTLVWVQGDGVVRGVEGDRWQTVDPPRGLPRPGEPLAPGEVRDVDAWALVPIADTAGGGWLAIERETPLHAAERQLLRGLAGAWSLPAVGAIEPDAVSAWVDDGDPVASPQAHGFVGRSAAVREILDMIRKVAATDVSVLVLGENGTGKELVAQAIHRGSARRRARFIAVNCASIPGTLLESELFGHERGAFTSAHARRLGRFELAHGGTLMLDEIGEMPLEMQAKLLRVLQERTFTRLGGTELVRSDARIIAATNRDLEREVERGRFRMDLYFRLNVVTIHVPPLRERSEDVEPLARHFLRRHGPEYGQRVRDLSPDALRALTAYAWPGNVRELENAIKHALVFATGELLRAENLPSSVLGRGPRAAGNDLERAVRGVVESDDFSEERPLMPRLELLLAHELVEKVQNKTMAARLLGVTKPTLYDRLRRFEALYGDDEDDDAE